MKHYYEDEAGFIDYLQGKKLFLWGTGKMAPVVTEWLLSRGIVSFSFVNSNPEQWGKTYDGRLIYSPEELFAWDRDAFLIISCSHLKELSGILSAHGWQWHRDYIDGLNLENELCLIKYDHIPPAPRLTLKEMSAIEAELREENLQLQSIAYRDEDIETLEHSMDFEAFYSKGKNLTYKRKMCEYLLNYKLLGLAQYSKDDIYVDVGSSTTPAVLTLRERYGLRAYGVDLCERPYPKSYYLQENAARTSFADNTISGISLQSSYCLFMGMEDMDFIRECSRILKRKGRVCISPLYLYKEYISLVSPQHYHKGYNDDGAKEYLRRDWPDIKMSRYYDVEHLKKRVIDLAESVGLKSTIFVLDNTQVPEYEFAYLKFILMLEKIK
ncbi:methyltransferase domain-containing protein [Oscillospiraceae bacterium 38-13]